VRQHGQVLEQVAVWIIEKDRGRWHPADHARLGGGSAIKVERLDATLP
jgi:hypothetical protein